MSGVDHLPSEEYRKRAERSQGSRLSLRAHEHLVATCPECVGHWEELGPKLQGLVRQELATAPPLTPPPEPHRDDLSGSDEAVELLAHQAATLRKRRRRAKKQLSELRLLPAARRADKVRGAYRRFRSRMLAELLIEEARSVVRNAPAEAESFAALVPLVLDWAQGGEEDAAWATTLAARATAHRANALRVAGELTEAERIFRSLDLRTIADARVRGEILSLEGSLLSDQRQFELARKVLQRAVRTYEYVGDRMGLAKVQIQQANLIQIFNDTEEVLHLFDSAAASLGSNAAPELLVSTLIGRVNALCDLRRPLEARSLLQSGLDLFEEFDEPLLAAHLRLLEGRISMAAEEYMTAEEYFRSAIGTAKMIGRPYDAAVGSLFLAESLLAQGRTKELRSLARKLIHDFRAREVSSEAVKALELFGKTVATEELTISLLNDIRRKISHAR